MDKEIRNLIKRLDNDGFAITHNGQLVRDFSRTIKIRKLRELDKIYIAKDRRKNITIVLKKDFFDIL